MRGEVCRIPRIPLHDSNNSLSICATTSDLSSGRNFYCSEVAIGIASFSMSEALKADVGQLTKSLRCRGSFDGRLDPIQEHIAATGNIPSAKRATQVGCRSRAKASHG